MRADVVTQSFLIALAAAGSAYMLTACHGDPGWSGQVPEANFELFRSQAYPVLMSDCGFNECHGAPQRFFQIFGPGRTRLLSTTKPDAPVTVSELQVSFDRTRSLLATEGNASVTTSLLLRKPLEAAAGGVGHRGVDDFGRNVYATAEAPGYQALLRWAQMMALPASAQAGGAPNAGGAGSAP